MLLYKAQGNLYYLMFCKIIKTMKTRFTQTTKPEKIAVITQ